MPVGLFMNKIESLHSSVSVAGNSSIISAEPIHHHEPMGSDEQLQPATQQQLSNECFKYLSKFNHKDSQATSEDLLFLLSNGSKSNINTNNKTKVDQINEHGEFSTSITNNTTNPPITTIETIPDTSAPATDSPAIDNSQMGSATLLKVESVAPKLTSIPVESTAGVNTNSFNKNTTTHQSLINTDKASESSNNHTNNGFYHISNVETSSNCLNQFQINASDFSSSVEYRNKTQTSLNSNTIQNTTISLTEEQQYREEDQQAQLTVSDITRQCQITDDKSLTVPSQITEIYRIHGSDRHDDDEERDATAGDSSLRNNIDFAIDTVLEKCRNDNSSDDDLFDSVANSLLSRPKKSRKQHKQHPESPGPRLLAQSVKANISSPTGSLVTTSVSQIVPDHVINFDANCPNPITQSKSSQQEQPMSKSSKARTSYISSLIANRQKTPSESSLKKQEFSSQSIELEKEKRISQNILTILANNSQHDKKQRQQQTLVIETNANSTSKLPLMPLSNPKAKVKKTTKYKKSPATKNQTQELDMTVESREIDFVINSYNNTNTNTNIFSTTSSGICDDQQHQVLVTMKHVQGVKEQSKHTQNSGSNGQSTFLECSNLKRLLLAPNMDTTSQNELVNSTNQIKTVLMDTSFDHIHIDVKQVVVDNGCQVVNNNKLSVNQLFLNNIHSSMNNMNIIRTENQTNFNDIKGSTITSANLSFNNQTGSICVSPQTNAMEVGIPAGSKIEPATANNSNDSTKESKKKRTSAKNTPTKKTSKKAKLKVDESTSTVEHSSIPAAIENSLEVTSQVYHKPFAEQSRSQKTVRTKKLKTIADIVKHNSEAQRNRLQELHHNQQQQNHPILPSEQQQQQQQQQQLISSNSNNMILAPPQFIPEANFAVKSSGLFGSSQLVNDTDMPSMSSMSIDHLLELEFNTDSDSVHNQQLIDKYIDLDDIDLNPLNSYQTSFHQHQQQHSHHHQQQQNQQQQQQRNQSQIQQAFTVNNSTAHQIDELNFQFSVCSSSSSGFSEPSTFSSGSSSQNSAFNLATSNSHQVFSSESESSPPTNTSQQCFHYENSSLINSPSYNLFQKSLRLTSDNKNVNSNNNFVIGEFTTNPNSTMISNSTCNNNMIIGNSQNDNSSTDNMFSSFSFLSDEINLKI